MILQYSDFQNWLNEKLFEESYSDLMKKIADNPDRFIGLFRPTKPKTKLIQNITQSHEIRFGDALEYIFERYFEAEGFSLQTKRFYDTNQNELSIDQLFEKDGILYMIEQKVRDDHDSTKKRGQFENFENKYYALTQRYTQYSIVPIMWFIDDSLVKNKKYYQEQMTRMESDYQCDCYLFYGQQMFKTHGGIPAFRTEIWEETLDYLEQWKQTLPDMPEINFDLNAEDVFEEIKNMSPSIYRKLLNNYDVISQIFPILFPNNEVLKKLRNYFCYKGQPIYQTLTSNIDKIIKSN